MGVSLTQPPVMVVDGGRDKTFVGFHLSGDRNLDGAGNAFAAFDVDANDLEAVAVTAARVGGGSPRRGLQRSAVAWQPLIRVDIDVEGRHGGVRLNFGMRPGEFDRLLGAGQRIDRRRAEYSTCVFLSTSPPDCCSSASCG